MIYIFLDIDGVFVKEGEIFDSTQTMFDQKCLMIFESILRQYGDQYQIVIASSWREVFSLEVIQANFSIDIADEIVGMTPFLSSYIDVEYARYKEVLQYLEKEGLQDVFWIAIDDVEEHYPPEVQSQVIHTNCYEGFGFAEAYQLQVFLEKSSML